MVVKSVSVKYSWLVVKCVVKCLSVNKGSASCNWWYPAHDSCTVESVTF